ncbi:unnamed protein product [Vitrella brassicaformis CCMP3155]|uniref:Protein kinase domain-containing protein n=1 Tax=Vitrella brassicaformis (strain CCMP3155) TaxID=1169540 RepID=A0A0G4GQU8_VITBC|nr:unnamed protein product [Vitrella brassicaformis CCMP3155]|eukprot:CEM32679.1 unnamed protein product [Vitrella brassicaformis CCMP3155]
MFPLQPDQQEGGAQAGSLPMDKKVVTVYIPEGQGRELQLYCITAYDAEEWLACDVGACFLYVDEKICKTHRGDLPSLPVPSLLTPSSLSSLTHTSEPSRRYSLPFAYQKRPLYPLRLCVKYHKSAIHYKILSIPLTSVVPTLPLSGSDDRQAWRLVADGRTGQALVKILDFLPTVQRWLSALVRAPHFLDCAFRGVNVAEEVKKRELVILPFKCGFLMSRAHHRHERPARAADKTTATTVNARDERGGEAAKHTTTTTRPGWLSPSASSRFRSLSPRISRSLTSIGRSLRTTFQRHESREGQEDFSELIAHRRLLSEVYVAVLFDIDRCLVKDNYQHNLNRWDFERLLRRFLGMSVCAENETEDVFATTLPRLPNSHTQGGDVASSGDEGVLSASLHRQLSTKTVPAAPGSPLTLSVGPSQPPHFLAATLHDLRQEAPVNLKLQALAALIVQVRRLQAAERQDGGAGASDTPNTSTTTMLERKHLDIVPTFVLPILCGEANKTPSEMGSSSVTPRHPPLSAREPRPSLPSQLLSRRKDRGRRTPLSARQAPSRSISDKRGAGVWDQEPESGRCEHGHGAQGEGEEEDEGGLSVALLLGAFLLAELCDWRPHEKPATIWRLCHAHLVQHRHCEGLLNALTIMIGHSRTFAEYIAFEPDAVRFLWSELVTVTDRIDRARRDAKRGLFAQQSPRKSSPSVQSSARTFSLSARPPAASQQQPNAPTQLPPQPSLSVPSAALPHASSAPHVVDSSYTEDTHPQHQQLQQRTAEYEGWEGEELRTARTERTVDEDDEEAEVEVEDEEHETASPIHPDAPRRLPVQIPRLNLSASHSIEGESAEASPGVHSSPFSHLSPTAPPLSAHQYPTNIAGHITRHPPLSRPSRRLLEGLQTSCGSASATSGGRSDRRRWLQSSGAHPHPSEGMMGIGELPPPPPETSMSARDYAGEKGGSPGTDEEMPLHGRQQSARTFSGQDTLRSAYHERISVTKEVDYVATLLGQATLLADLSGVSTIQQEAQLQQHFHARRTKQGGLLSPNDPLVPASPPPTGGPPGDGNGLLKELEDIRRDTAAAIALTGRTRYESAFTNSPPWPAPPPQPPPPQASEGDSAEGPRVGLDVPPLSERKPIPSAFSSPALPRLALPFASPRPPDTRTGNMSARGLPSPACSPRVVPEMKEGVLLVTAIRVREAVAVSLCLVCSIYRQTIEAGIKQGKEREREGERSAALLHVDGCFGEALDMTKVMGVLVSSCDMAGYSYGGLVDILDAQAVSHRVQTIVSPHRTDRGSPIEELGACLSRKEGDMDVEAIIRSMRDIITMMETVPSPSMQRCACACSLMASIAPPTVRQSSADDPPPAAAPPVAQVCTCLNLLTADAIMQIAAVHTYWVASRWSVTPRPPLPWRPSQQHHQPSSQVQATALLRNGTSTGGPPPPPPPADVAVFSRIAGPCGPLVDPSSRRPIEAPSPLLPNKASQKRQPVKSPAKRPVSDPPASPVPQPSEFLLRCAVHHCDAVLSHLRVHLTSSEPNTPLSALSTGRAPIASPTAVTHQGGESPAAGHRQPYGPFSPRRILSSRQQEDPHREQPRDNGGSASRRPFVPPLPLQTHNHSSSRVQDMQLHRQSSPPVSWSDRSSPTIVGQEGGSPFPLPHDDVGEEREGGHSARKVGFFSGRRKGRQSGERYRVGAAGGKDREGEASPSATTHLPLSSRLAQASPRGAASFIAGRIAPQMLRDGAQEALTYAEGMDDICRRALHLIGLELSIPEDAFVSTLWRCLTASEKEEVLQGRLVAALHLVHMCLLTMPANAGTGTHEGEEAFHSVRLTLVDVKGYLTDLWRAPVSLQRSLLSLRLWGAFCMTFTALLSLADNSPQMQYTLVHSIMIDRCDTGGITRRLPRERGEMTERTSSAAEDGSPSPLESPSGREQTEELSGAVGGGGTVGGGKLVVRKGGLPEGPHRLHSNGSTAQTELEAYLPLPLSQQVRRPSVMECLADVGRALYGEAEREAHGDTEDNAASLDSLRSAFLSFTRSLLQCSHRALLTFPSHYFSTQPSSRLSRRWQAMDGPPTSRVTTKQTPATTVAPPPTAAETSRASPRLSMRLFSPRGAGKWQRAAGGSDVNMEQTGKGGVRKPVGVSHNKGALFGPLPAELPRLNRLKATRKLVEWSSRYLQWLDFLFNTNTGLITAIQDTPNISGKVTRELLLAETALFRIPSALNRFLAEPHVGRYIRWHFVDFMALYSSTPEEWDECRRDKCVAHLEVLFAISCNKTEPASEWFYRLRMVEFLLSQMDFEQDIDASHHRYSDNLPTMRPSRGGLGLSATQPAPLMLSGQQSALTAQPLAATLPPLQGGVKLQLPPTLKPPPPLPPPPLPAATAAPIADESREEGRSGGGDGGDSSDESSSYDGEEGPPVAPKPPPVRVLPKLRLGGLPGPTYEAVPGDSVAEVIQIRNAAIQMEAKSSEQPQPSSAAPKPAHTHDSSSSSDEDRERGARRYDGSHHDHDSDSSSDWEGPPPPVWQVPASRKPPLFKLNLGHLPGPIYEGDGAHQHHTNNPIYSPNPAMSAALSASASPQLPPPVVAEPPSPFTPLLPTDTYAISAPPPPAAAPAPAPAAPHPPPLVSPSAADSAMAKGEGEDIQDEYLENEVYFKGREYRRLYSDPEIHSLMLGCLLTLLLTDKRGLLDERYCAQFPLTQNKENAPFVLQRHLNHEANESVVLQLLWTVAAGRTALAFEVFRLFKLLFSKGTQRWRGLFDCWERLGSGAFGQVYRCTTPFEAAPMVAVKQISVPVGIQDQCTLFSVFHEVACLDEFRLAAAHVCEIFDYGLELSDTSAASPDPPPGPYQPECTSPSGPHPSPPPLHYVIIMRFYPSTLKKWRNRLVQGQGERESERAGEDAERDRVPLEHLPTLLAIFGQILTAIGQLHARGVVHYDLKCDNIMVDTGADRQVYILLDGPSATGPHTQGGDDGQQQGEDVYLAVPMVALADFGESRIMADEADSYCIQNRGTEFIKSPEMILIHQLSKKEGVAYDRRRKVGSSLPSDVWSLGCLLFELLTGRFLFEEDFAYFFVRITKEEGPLDLISPENQQRLRSNPDLLQFLRFMLVRDPNKRPSVEMILHRFEKVFARALLLYADPSTAKATQLRLPSLADSLHAHIHAQPSPFTTPLSINDAGGRQGSHLSMLSGSAGDSPMAARREGMQELSRLPHPPLVQILEDLFWWAPTQSNQQQQQQQWDAGELDEAAVEWVDLARRGVQSTHLVDFRAKDAAPLRGLPLTVDVLRLNEDTVPRPPEEQERSGGSSSSSRDAHFLIRCMPVLADFLRAASVQGGTVVVLDEENAQARRVSSGSAMSGGGGGLPSVTQPPLVSCPPRRFPGLLALLGLLMGGFELDAFRATCLLNSQVPLPALHPRQVHTLIALDRLIQRRRVEARRRAKERAPAGGKTCLVACYCGACTFRVSREALMRAARRDQPLESSPYHRMSDSVELLSCACSPSPPSPPSTACPNAGSCQSFVEWFEEQYGQDMQSLHWLIALPPSIPVTQQWRPPVWADGLPFMSRGVDHNAEAIESDEPISSLTPTPTPAPPAHPQPAAVSPRIRAASFFPATQTPRDQGSPRMVAPCSPPVAWRRYQCRICGWLTHAVRVRRHMPQQSYNTGSGSGGGEGVAVVVSYDQLAREGHDSGGGGGLAASQPLLLEASGETSQRTVKVLQGGGAMGGEHLGKQKGVSAQHHPAIDSVRFGGVRPILRHYSMADLLSVSEGGSEEAGVAAAVMAT